MHLIDLILMILIAAAVFLAVRRIIRNKKEGRTCSGACEGCPGCGSVRGRGPREGGR